MVGIFIIGVGATVVLLFASYESNIYTIHEIKALVFDQISTIFLAVTALLALIAYAISVRIILWLEEEIEANRISAKKRAKLLYLPRILLPLITGYIEALWALSMKMAT